jgi:hypothetical protein
MALSRNWTDTDILKMRWVKAQQLAEYTSEAVTEAREEGRSIHRLMRKALDAQRKADQLKQQWELTAPHELILNLRRRVS